MLGDGIARHNLGQYEAQKGNTNRAVKHWIIAATGSDWIQGFHGEYPPKAFVGHATKADYEKALSFEGLP